MDKIILTRDIILNKLETEPGQNGILLVEQDDVGGHIASLSPNDKGFVDLALSPNGVTEVTWVRDDVTTYWSSKKLTSDVVINNPSVITDLSLEIVDTISAKVNWTAPEGFAGDSNSKADLYYLVISSSALVPNVNYTGVKLAIQPKAAGVAETYIIPSLESGKRYYAAIYSQRSGFGAKRVSSISNVITFVTTALEGNINTPKRIPLHAEKIYQPLAKVAFADGEMLTNYPEFKRLAEVQDYFIDNGGVPSGLPPYSQVAATSSYNTWEITWYNIGNFYKIYFELDSFYTVDYIYCLFGTNNRFKIWTSSDGINLIEGYDRDTNPYNMYDGWVKIPLSSNAKTGVKYIVLGVSGGSSWYNGFIPYGTKEVGVNILGEKYKSAFPVKPLSKAMGTNLFPNEQQMDWTSQVSNFHRIYTVSDWIMSGEYRNFGVVSTNPDDIKMASSSSHFVNWEAKFEEMRTLGIEDFCITLTSDFIYLRDSDDGKSKPLNKGLNQYDLSVTTNPLNYSHAARIWGALAYRWGYNPNAPEAYNQFVENDGKKGLGYVKFYEPGNERDRHWDGAAAFMNPEEMAAFLSAIWDGHNGAMGVGFGIKGADPNAVLVMPGLFSINRDFLAVMKMWWDLNRGKGNYPVGFVNFHHYNAYAGINNLPSKYPPLSIPAYALMPEKGYLIKEVEVINQLRYLDMPNAYLGVTEFGYGESYRCVYGFSSTSPLERGLLKAYGLLRSYMVYNSLGIDIICQYIYGQTGQENPFFLEGLGPQEVLQDKFATSMLTEGIEYYNSPNRKRLLSFWYVAAFKKELEGYVYTHTVVEEGTVLISETDIVDSYSNDTWIFAYKHITTNETILIVWKSVDDFSTYVVKLRVANSASIIQKTDFINQQTRQTIYGNVANLLPTIENSSKYIQFQSSALPVIIKTSLVGTGKLKAPKNVKTETISPTSIKLVWRDENIGTNKARIYMSTDPVSNFTIVEETYRDNAETTITGLVPNTAYYFRVQFVDGFKVSNVSETISSKTSKILVAPTNLTQDISTSSTITLVWSYPTLEELNATDFVIYRSTTLNGIYSEIARVPIASRLYRDFGLTPSSQYYYKIKAYGDGSSSAFSFSLAGTTSAPSYIPPTIQSMTTSAAGDTIELYFDEDLKDEQTAINAFSIMEKYGSKVIYHPVTSISIPSNNLSKVVLGFDIPIFKTSTITVSYSANLGALKSVYNFPVNTFSNYLVVNAVAVLYTPVVEFNSLYNISVNGNNLTGIGSGNAVSKVKIAAGTTAILQWNVDTNNGMIVGLDQTVDPEGNSGMDFYTRKYLGKQEWKKGANTGLSSQTLNKGLMRFRTDGTTIYYEHSTDSGISWITVQTAVQPNIDLYIKMFCEASGQQLNNIVGINLVGSTQIVVPAPPTNMVIDDVLNTVTFTPNPGYTLGEHEYCTNYSSFTQNWLIVPSNPIAVGDVNIPSGDFAIRVREATDRAASAAIVSNVDITGTINTSSAIMVQKSNGGTVLFGCATRQELDAWLSTAHINENITVQFNTATNYLLTSPYTPSYNNGTNWVTFQGAAGVRPSFDVQGLSGTVWNINNYTILRNIEFRNGDLEAPGATLIRADQRHHCKFFDLIFDTGFCCIRATDGGTAGLGIYEFEVDNIIVRNVWGGSFRINGETTNPNCNMSFKNVLLDSASCDSAGKGALLPNSTRQFSGGLVLKQQNGLVVENFRSLSNDFLFDMGEIENCNDVTVKNVRGRSMLILGSFAGNQYSNFQQTGKNFKFYNCYFPDVASYMTELDGVDMIHSQFKLSIYQCKNLKKFRGNIFKEGLTGFLMSPADMPTQESDNIMIASGVNGRYVNWNFPSAPDFYVDESNKANYKLTQGLNSIFVPYANRAMLNQNPNGSLRLNSIGKGAITTVLEGIDVDTYNVNRVYPTDIGPYSGLQPDQNDQPLPPTAIGDNATRALIFSHPLGPTEIVYSTNGGPFIQYTGVITVPDTPVSANYYLAKVKAAAYRNESATVGSPAFDAKPVDNSYQVLRTVEINFKSTGAAAASEPNVNSYQTNASGSSTSTSLVVPLVDKTGAAFGTAMNYQKGFSGTTTDACPTGLAYIRSEQCFTSALEINDSANPTKVKFTGLDPTKFYQFYVMSCSQYSNNKVRITIGSQYKDWIVSLNYPLAANGDIYSNPAVARFNDNVPDSNGELIIEFLKDAESSWQHVAVNYIVIEETNKAKPS